MSTPHTIDFEEAVSGVTYQFVDASGLVGSPVAVASPFVDHAYLALADDPTGALGIRWAWTRTADGLSYTQLDLFGPQAAQLAALAMAVLRGPVIVRGPWTKDGVLQIARGDDYADADGRAIPFGDLSWPVLTGGTVVLKIGAVTIPTTLTGARTLHAEPTATQTAALVPGSRYDLVATLSNGHVVTLERGPVQLTQGGLA